MQPAWLRNLQVTKVALCGRGMNQEAQVALYKSAEVPSDPKEKATMADPTVAKSDHDAVVAELEAAKAELAALADITDDDLAALRGFEIAKAEPVEDDDVLKGLPDAVRKRLEDAEATIAKMEQERRAEQFAKKAADEYAHVAPAADLAPVLELLDRVAPEQAKVLDQCLKAANARIAEGGIFTEVGSDADAGDDTVAKAEALIAKAVEGGLSRVDAIRKVLSENPELVTPARSVK